MTCKLPIIELAGSPERMGETFGEQCREEIRELYVVRLEAAIRFAAGKGRVFRPEQVLGIARQCLEPTAAYDPVGYREFLGIARGASLAPEQLYAMQGLTDLRDVLGFGPPPDGVGCSSFVVAGDRAAGGQLLLGQTWDLQTDNMPFVRLVHRRPDDTPETWCLTLSGCLTLIGINAAGIAVGNTNLQTTDARVGVQYLTVLHRALRSRSLAEAVDSICQAPRAGAHYYYAAGPDGVAFGLECSARQAVRFEVASGIFVHCNHALSPEIAALEATPPGSSSSHRQGRLRELLDTHPGPLGVDDLKRLLADHEGGPGRCICRHDRDGVSTNATVILSPSTREIHACRAQPHLGEWATRQVGG
ncbi:MAG: C45 family peptidase [Lentisphaeria bacterium]|jgi:isopenicillin-N N-acyltransferase-like protein|nr:C45 family peptidase [Lentisphaeria bacterium]